MAIVDFKDNKPLSAKEIKARVMKATGWSSDQYQKQYDILRNKTRNYEAVTGATSRIKVNELLYQQTMAQKRYGSAYKPSRLMQAIQITPSVGTGVVKSKGLSPHATAVLEREILGQFTGFTSKSTEGARIVALFRAQKDGSLDAQIAHLQNEYADALESGEVDMAEQIAQEINELKSAPRTLADLKKQLESAAKSLKEFQKNKRGEWKEKNPDAPASYAVGTP